MSMRQVWSHQPWSVRIACVLMVAAVLASILLSVSALAQAATRTAVITFPRPTTYVDGSALLPATVVTYNVYQGTKGNLAKPKVGTITTTSTTISTGLVPGETCWQITAIANGIESALSNEACKTFPFISPDTVVITVT